MSLPISLPGRLTIGQVSSRRALDFLSQHSQYCHSIPGRLRLELPGLAGNPQAADAIQQLLLEQSGVRSARASTVTGRVLIHYDSRLTSAERLASTLLNHTVVLPHGLCGNGGFWDWAAETAMRWCLKGLLSA